MELNKVLEDFSKSLDLGNPDNIRTASLATMPLSDDGYPANRTIILRDFNQKDMSLMVYTHSLSNKVEEIANNPNSTILWYDHILQRQIQFHCYGKIVLDEDVVAKHQSQIKKHSEKDYLGKKPGTLYQKALDLHELRFCVLEFAIEKMIVLQIGKEEHFKYLFESDSNGFNKVRLMP